jgi:hypothetical protein
MPDGSSGGPPGRAPISLSVGFPEVSMKRAHTSLAPTWLARP